MPNSNNGSSNNVVSKLLKSNHQFKKLYEGHEELESQLAEFNRLPHLTEQQEVERKRIQKIKLSQKDEMERIIRDHEPQEVSLG